MVDLFEPITLHDAEQQSITLPLQNFLRITFVHLLPFFLAYQEETKDSHITGFADWMKKKLDMGQGKQVLL